jgi:hypothetical protein
VRISWGDLCVCGGGGLKADSAVQRKTAGIRGHFSLV